MNSTDTDSSDNEDSITEDEVTDSDDHLTASDESENINHQYIQPDQTLSQLESQNLLRTDPNGAFHLLLCSMISRGDSLLEVKNLLEDTINIYDIRGHYRKWTPLHEACYMGRYDVAEYLLREHNVEINARDSTGATPLDLAIRSRHDHLLRLLLEYGSDMTSKSKKKITICERTLEHGSFDALKLLEQHGLDINNNNKALSGLLTFSYALMDRGKQYIVFLLEHGWNPHRISQYRHMPTTWLIQAAESGDLDLLKLFYSIGIDANFSARHARAIFMSITQDCFEFLIDQPETDIYCLDEDGHTILHEAASFGDVTLFKRLLEKGFDITDYGENGKSTLIVAARLQRVDLLRFLMNQGVDPYREDEDGNNALFAAISQKAMESIKILVEEFNVDVDWKSSKNITAIEHPNCDSRSIKPYLKKQLRRQVRERRLLLEPIDDTTKPVLITGQAPRRTSKRLRGENPD